MILAKEKYSKICYLTMKTNGLGFCVWERAWKILLTTCLVGVDFCWTPFLGGKIVLSAECGKDEIEEIIFFLGESKNIVLASTTEYGRAVRCHDAIADYILLFKNSNNSKTRFNVTYVLENIGDKANTSIPTLLPHLNPDIEPDPTVRERIAYALGEFQSPTDEVLEALESTLLDDPNMYARAAAAYSLGSVGADSDKVLPVLVAALENPSNNSIVCERIAMAMANYGLESRKYLDVLKSFVQSPNSESESRLAAARAIEAVAKAMADEAIAEANNIKKIWFSFRDLRIISKEIEAMLGVLEAPELAKIHGEIEDQKELVDGRHRDLTLLVGRQWFGGFSRLGATHGLVWLALIFAYPRSPMVQTAFFWNPRIRGILGFPYVTGALKWVPFFRKILFVPFRDALRSDANLDLFKGQTYYPDLRVKAEGWSESQPITQVISQLKGQIVLQGESGSGKSMILRYLLSQSPRIAVYLPAQKCAQGVIAAIQAKLYGQAQDADFLRDLIYSGAIDIYIDGLNEATPDTRASIKDFVEKNFKGNIILATQPLEWSPPGQVYHLQPLDLSQIQAFLQRHAPAASATYAQDCAVYLAGVQADLAAEAMPTEEKAMLRQGLSNPMDLTVVAQLIASQKQPDLLRLREQQYLTMAADYQRIYLGQAFPLAAFSTMAYGLRLESQTQIPEADFGDELPCLERHKMVVRRQRAGSNGEGETQWFFRHEKVADFFIAQSFLQATDDRQTRHFDDSRFRGVYLLLGTLLPEPQKMALREQLIQYAVRHGDHVLSDAFIRLVGSPSLPLL